MERPLAGAPRAGANNPGPAGDAPRPASPETRARAKSSHLMCGTPLWGIAGAAASAYFAYVSYSHLINAEYSWPHTWWTVLTYAVWVTVVGGLLTETLCRRERIFFGLMLLIFLLGLAVSAWSAAPEHAVRQLRIASTALWALAAVACLTTAFGAKNRVDAVRRDSPEGAK